MVLVVNLTRPRCRLLLATPGWVERAGRAGAVATLVLDTAPRSVDRSLMFYMHHSIDIKTKED